MVSIENRDNVVFFQKSFIKPWDKIYCQNSYLSTFVVENLMENCPNKILWMSLREKNELEPRQRQNIPSVLKTLSTHILSLYIFIFSFWHLTKQRPCKVSFGCWKLKIKKTNRTSDQRAGVVEFKYVVKIGYIQRKPFSLDIYCSIYLHILYSTK